MWDTTPDMFEGGISNANPQKQQGPLDEVGNDASGSIIDALEHQTESLLIVYQNEIIKQLGGCPPEIRRSVIENATQYGETDDNALYGLAVWDLYDTDLMPKGVIFTNPSIDNFQDIVYGYGDTILTAANKVNYP